MNEKEPRIVQLIPAMGWLTLYPREQESMNRTPRAKRVLAWALVEDAAGKQLIDGVVMGDVGPELVNFDPQKVKFNYDGS